jgi:hypothetical protein
LVLVDSACTYAQHACMTVLQYCKRDLFLVHMCTVHKEPHNQARNYLDTDAAIISTLPAHQQQLCPFPVSYATANTGFTETAALVADVFGGVPGMPTDQLVKAMNEVKFRSRVSTHANQLSRSKAVQHMNKNRLMPLKVRATMFAMQRTSARPTLMQDLGWIL